jgi:NADH dehydrogenase
MVRYAETCLKEYGIEVIHNQRISRVAPEGAYLSGGTLLRSSMVISTIGQRRMVLGGTEHLERDKVQRLKTNSFLQVSGQQQVWGGGDACHVPYCNTTDPCPSNALWAIKHGTYAGRNIARAIKGKGLKPFDYKGLGQTASLGMGKGITELYGLQFTGLIAWIMRLVFFLYFMPSKRVMMEVITDWLRLLVTGDRQALAPQPVAAVTKAREAVVAG